MADPIRIRFLLELLERPQTVKEVAETLGVPPTRLYYHLRILERHGLVEIAKRRMVSGIEERTYRATSESYTVPPTLVASMLYESGALRAMLDVVRAEMEVAVLNRPDLPMDAPGSPLSVLTLTEFALSPDDMEEVRRTFEELMIKFGSDGTKARGKELFRLFFAMYPAPATTPAKDGE